MPQSKPCQNKKMANKMIFNLWKTVTTSRQSANQMQGEITQAMTKEPPLKLRCCVKWWNQRMGKGAKMVHRQKIITILEQLQQSDMSTMVFRFYSIN